MSTFRVFGTKLVSETELTQRRTEVASAIANGRNLALRAGTVTAAEFAAPAPPSLPALQPLGFGLPLTIQIRHLYTGRFPATIFGSANMLVTSSVKNLDQFDAATRAVNFLMPKQSSRKNFASPPADQNGTPLVCYVPAVTAISTTITFNLIFQRFADDILSEISSIFSQAASIPLFMAASPYLIGAGSVLKLAGDIGDAIFNGTPDYSPTETLSFIDPLDPVQAAGLIVMLKNEEDPSTDPHTLTLDAAPGQHGLIDPKTKTLYAGPAPYLVISVDGTKQDSLKGFTPTAASAAILAKFFNIKDGGQVPVSDVIDALKALNDVKYRQAADDLQKQLAAATPDQQPALQKQLAAMIANIQNPDLKPKQ